MSAQYSLENTQSMFTKMLHFRWVSFLGIQRVCDNQDFVGTEQFKGIFQGFFEKTFTVHQ